jgi:DNA repair/transcription protein MET18/MMS19
MVETNILPLLFHSLPDNAPEVAETKQRATYRAILKAIRELCVSPALFETLVIRIPNKLESINVTSGPMATSDGSDDERRECDIAYAYDLIACLDETAKSKITDKHADLNKHFDAIIPKIWRLVVDAATTRGSAPIWIDRRLLGLVGRLTDRLVWQLDSRQVYLIRQEVCATNCAASKRRCCRVSMRCSRLVIAVS